MTGRSLAFPISVVSGFFLIRAFRGFGPVDLRTTCLVDTQAPYTVSPSSGLPQGQAFGLTWVICAWEAVWSELA